MGKRRVLFWLGVAGMSIIAPFGFNVIVDKVPSLGLKRLRDYIYQAPGA